MGDKKYEDPNMRDEQLDSSFSATPNDTQSNDEISSQENIELLEENQTEIPDEKIESTNEVGLEELNDSEIISSSSIDHSNDQPTYYIGFGDRVVIYAALSLICLFVTVFFLSKIISGNEELITYREKSNIDYKVYLKKNDFYESEYLGRDMVYVASLIRKIDIDFHYLFDISKSSDILFDYDVIGDLVILDSTGNNVFFEKEYNLLEESSEQMQKSKQFQIDRIISIDYDHFNDLANKFRSEYGVNTNSNLVVKLRIHEKSASTNDYKWKNSSEMTITIPLSEKEVKIKMDYKDIDTHDQFYAKSNSHTFMNVVCWILCMIFMTLMCVFILRFLDLVLKSRRKESSYDRYIHKILKEYDRLIVDTPTPPFTKNVRVIEVNSFSELLDVRDNLNLPIKYYVVAKHHKCNFYIDHGDELYLLIVKSVDIEEDKDGKDI